MMRDGATTLLGSAWDEVMAGVTQMFTNDYAKLGLTIGLVGAVIGVAKKLFRRK